MLAVIQSGLTGTSGHCILPVLSHISPFRSS